MKLRNILQNIILFIEMKIIAKVEYKASDKLTRS